MGANARTAPAPGARGHGMSRPGSTALDWVQCALQRLRNEFLTPFGRCFRKSPLALQGCILHRACRTKFVPPVRRMGGAMRAAVRVVSFRRRARRPAPLPPSRSWRRGSEAGTALSALAAPSGT